MPVCVDCGIQVNADGTISVDTSTDWASLGFPGPDTGGSPIYCDSAGQIRTVPEHTSFIGQSGSLVGPFAIVPGSFIPGPIHAVVVANATLRPMSVIWTYQGLYDVIASGGAGEFVPNTLIYINGGLVNIVNPIHVWPFTVFPWRQSETSELEGQAVLPSGGVASYEGQQTFNSISVTGQIPGIGGTVFVLAVTR